jgi:hypothetical protein
VLLLLLLLPAVGLLLLLLAPPSLALGLQPLPFLPLFALLCCCCLLLWLVPAVLLLLELLTLLETQLRVCVVVLQDITINRQHAPWRSFVDKTYQRQQQGAWNSKCMEKKGVWCSKVWSVVLQGMTNGRYTA